MVTACAAAGGTSGGGGPGLSITSPRGGAAVGSTFDLVWESDVPLGAPNTGRDHVHIFVDGRTKDYTVVGGNRFTVEGLSPGTHTVTITRQHADHSDAGASDEVQVNVSGGAGQPSPRGNGAPGGGRGY